MRTVTAHLFDSVGGVVKSANLWQFDQFDADLGRAMAASIATVQTVLLGRVRYEEWASYWPNADDDNSFAAFINPFAGLLDALTLTTHPVVAGSGRRIFERPWLTTTCGAERLTPQESPPRASQ
ncbi:MAG: hypothetical protein H7269_00390 [Cellulomonas sp.]|nr:hypothetical protein [Cellulomonas sp.]